MPNLTPTQQNYLDSHPGVALQWQLAQPPEPIDYEALYGAAGDAAVRQTQASSEEAQKIANANLARYPSTAKTARDVTMMNAAEFNTYLRSQIDADVASLAGPDWKQTILQPAMDANRANTQLAQNYGSNIMPGLIGRAQNAERAVSYRAQQFLSGELPADVSAMVRQAAAEGSAGAGMFGQAAGGRTARDLGISSLDLITQGANMAGLGSNLRTATSQLYGTGMNIVQSPINASSALSNLINAYRAPITDVGQMFQTISGQITGIANQTPNAVLQTGAQIYGANLSTAAQISMANQDMAWNGQLSRIGIITDAQNRAAATRAGNAVSNTANTQTYTQAGAMIGSMATMAMMS